MQETYNRQRIMRKDHTKFGGVIYPSDFNTESRGKPRVNGSLTASRIAQDQRFDDACRKNVQKLKMQTETSAAPKKGAEPIA
ncbi:MAG: hypothetical protein K2K90_07050 [Lachnospiraceae bacterium]|nr:hypothetical protein [Lachnospiraceae bacterium]